MNIEIKYRIWDDKFKMFFYWGFDIKEKLKGFSGLPNNETLTIDYCRKNSEQYIGRKDKNDKNIYMGDIVEDDVGRHWIVNYLSHKATFIFEWVKDRRQYQTFSRFNKEQKPLTIIGHIHEELKC